MIIMKWHQMKYFILFSKIRNTFSGDESTILKLISFNSNLPILITVPYGSLSYHTELDISYRFNFHHVPIKMFQSVYFNQNIRIC